MSDLQWYLVFTAPNGERHALEELGRQGIKAYGPVERRFARSGGKKYETERPLFPRYIFVALDVAAPRFFDVRSTYGVGGFVQAFGSTRPFQIPASAVKELKARELAGEFDHTAERRGEPAFPIGSRVKVIEGKYAGHFAEVVSAKAEDRVMILIQVIRGARTKPREWNVSHLVAA